MALYINISQILIVSHFKPCLKHGRGKGGNMAWNKTPKYKNEKVEIDGIKFDSKREAKRYHELKILEKAGIIKNLQMQVKYILIPEYREPDIVGSRGGIKKGKIIERECSYIADFVYQENGKIVVEDVKGYRDPSSAGYAKFVIKRKLMLHVHGIRIIEV